MDNKLAETSDQKEKRTKTGKDKGDARSTRTIKSGNSAKKVTSTKKREGEKVVRPAKSSEETNGVQIEKKTGVMKKNNADQNNVKGNNRSSNYRKKRKKKKTQRVILISVITILAVLVIGIIAFGIMKNASSDKEGFHELKEGEDISNIKTEIKISEDYVEPAEGTLDVSKIQGYNAKSVDDNEEEGDESVKEILVSDSNLKIESVGSYSGIFIEDGSDEPVTNVAAMLITNNSEQMLQIAEVTFKVNETETATFKVTNLPAGTSTLALETNKREFKDTDSYTYGETVTGYTEPLGMEEDKFEMTAEKGKITLKNKSDQSYEKVYVYYKYVQLGGAYLGGITYRTPFENVEPGAEVEAIAAHFNPDSSLIMGVQILSE